jgi:NADPH-dependent ferric siderophore reductase
VALLEVASEEEHQEIRTRSEADLRWLRRGGAADAVRELGLPWGRGHVWGAGESRTMRAVRDQLRGRPGVEKLQVLGYWSRGR